MLSWGSASGRCRLPCLLKVLLYCSLGPHSPSYHGFLSKMVLLSHQLSTIT